jgi:hypothetical protein
MDPLSFCRGPASSAFAPGNFLEDLLETVLMNMRDAIVRHAGLCPETSRDKAFENWRGQARKVITSVGTGGIGFVVFTMVLLSGTVADERAPCTPDAFRLCASYALDAASVEIFLRR